MTRRLALIGCLLSLALPGSASADNRLDLRRGEATFSSDEAGLSNDYAVQVKGADVSFRDDKDPAGTNTFPIECRAGETRGGVPIEILCSRSSIRTIVLTPAGGEDRLQSLIADIPTFMVGGIGTDSLVSGPGGDDMSGEQGNDTLTGAAGDDTLDGDEGNDTLDGGEGNDKLTGGIGLDTFNAGAGDDTIQAADGVAEKVDCGDGNDTISADGSDELTGCESVTRSSVASPADQPAADDKVRPTVKAAGLSSQRARGRAARFVVTCSEAGVAQASGYVDADGLYTGLKSTSRKITVGGGGAKLKLAFPARVVKLVRRDLERRRKPRVRITVTCTDAAGNTSRPKRFWIALRR